LISGIAQIAFGIIIAFVKNPKINNILYYTGTFGNALAAFKFIFVRLFTPSFSPEGTQVNELDYNGIITLTIEILMRFCLCLS